MYEQPIGSATECLESYPAMNIDKAVEYDQHTVQ